MYTKEKYPSAMRKLPEKKRDKAIRIANSMIIDGDIRVHEEMIIACAMFEAEQSIPE
jgi:uncharacterized protein YdaT